MAYNIIVKNAKKKYAYVFNGEHKICRGRSTIEKRDYELMQEQLIKRERNRLYSGRKNKNSNAHGILVWYDEKLNELDNELYRKIYKAEYGRQKRCAMLGYIGRKNPSEHFLFDFDLEQMLNDNVYVKNGKYNEYITKCVDGKEKFNLGAYMSLRKDIMKKMYIIAHLEWGYE